jgi:hypothetical protein
MDSKKWMGTARGIMKYFTKEWFSGDLTDQEAEKVKYQYWNYINSIYSNLFFPLKLLSKQINLHDSVITEICINEKNSSLILNMISGDLETGYFSLQISYNQVENIKKKSFDCIDFSKSVEILSDEIEKLTEKRFSHKILFSSKEEIDIHFGNIAIKIADAPDKSRKYACILKVHSV